MSHTPYIDNPDDDPTDELPVFSEAALREHARSAETQTLPSLGPEGAARSEDSARLQPETALLVARIADLERMLADSAAQLESQYQEIEEQRRAIERWRLEAARHERECAEIAEVLAAERERSAALRAEFSAARPAGEQPSDEGTRSRRDNELEARIEAHELTIAELKTELEQRIAREQESRRRAERDAERVQALERALRDAEAAHKARERQLRGAPLASPEDATEDLRVSGSPTTRTDEDPRLVMAWPPAGATSSLVCMTSEKPESHPLKPATTVTIGRGAHCAIQVPTHYVSREHARLTVGPRHVTLEDLDSRNGVFVNDVRVQTQQLKHGDLITIGETQFRFVADHSD